MDSKGDGKKRSGSFSGTAKSAGAVRCYGVSQGFYAVKTGFAIGTSSLGSCFALIACKGQKVVFAHVQAGTTLASLIAIINHHLPGVTSVTVVRGISTSKQTEELITQLGGHFTITKEQSESTAVVYDPMMRQLKKPSNIAATNDDYTENNAEGRVMGLGEDIQKMTTSS
jgi:hypothetical protein